MHKSYTMHRKDFTQDFKFGGNLNKIVDAEGMCKYPPTGGEGGRGVKKILKRMLGN